MIMVDTLYCALKAALLILLCAAMCFNHTPGGASIFLRSFPPSSPLAIFLVTSGLPRYAHAN